MQLLTVIVVISVAAFMVGWLGGYRKACRVHGWYLPQFDWQKDNLAPKNDVAMLRPQRRWFVNRGRAS
jgi:hypothetical protein